MSFQTKLRECNVLYESLVVGNGGDVVDLFVKMEQLFDYARDNGYRLDAGVHSHMKISFLDGTCELVDLSSEMVHFDVLRRCDVKELRRIIRQVMFLINSISESRRKTYIGLLRDCCKLPKRQVLVN